MRDLLFKCPECAASLAFDRKLASKTLSCPTCKKRIAVPVPDSTFNCPSCNAELYVSSNTEGEFECPTCKGAIAIEGEPASIEPESAIEEKPKLRLKDKPMEKQGRQCPKCNAGMAEDDVICIHCGHDLRTGKRWQPSSGLQTDGDQIAFQNPCQAGKHSNALIWMVAAVPLIGSVIEYAARLEVPWFAYVLTYSALCVTDERLLRKAGRPVPNGLWFALMFIPIYLWRRATLLAHKRRSYFWVWIGAFMLSIAIDHYASNVSQLEKSAVPVVTDILKENLGGDAKCATVKLGKKQTNGVYQATATLDDGNRIEVTVEDKDKQIEVAIPKILQYLVAKKQAADRNPNAAQAEQARKMVAASYRLLVKKAIASVKDENPTQDVATIVEAVVGWESPFWPSRAELFRGAGDDGPTNALSLYDQGAKARTRKDYRQAIDLYSRAIQKDAGFPWTFNNLAWLLATCPDKSLRNGTKAVDFAKSAINAVGIEYWGFAGTLAAAYAQCGDFENAVLWEQKTIDSAPPDQKDEERQHMRSFKNRQTVTDDKPPPGFKVEERSQ